MMTTLYVYDHIARKFGVHCLDRKDSLPYLTHRGISIGQFLSGSHTDIAWTDRRLLAAYDRLCELWGGTLPCLGGFKRLFDGNFKSAHYAGLALHIACPAEKDAFFLLQKYAHKVFTHVDPPYLTPGWLYAELASAPAMPWGYGYPALSPDAAGVHVFVLQDALLRLGHHRGALTGRMDAATLEAAARFRARHGLTQTVSVGGTFWQALFRELMQ